MLDSVNGRFAPEQPEQRIALLGNLTESLSGAARVLARDETDVSGHGLSVSEAPRIAEEHFRRQGGHGTDTGMGHEPCSLRALLRVRADALIEFSDLVGQLHVQRLEVCATVSGVWQERQCRECRLAGAAPQSGASANAMCERQS